jgi:hypothetical protein
MERLFTESVVKFFPKRHQQNMDFGHWAMVVYPAVAGLELEGIL